MNPIDWINSKLRDFLALPGKWAAWYEEARQIYEAEARARFARGSYEQSQRELAAIEAMFAIEKLRQEHRAVLDKLVVQDAAALGAIPIVVGVIGAISLTLIVLAITGIFRKSTGLESAIDALRTSGATPAQILEALRVAPEEQSALEAVVSGTVNLVKWFVIGGAVFLLLPVIRERFRA